ncbi:YegP family protein [Dyadobacter psychrotolerans]|nr:YegP family protein [Dyadobacter psychrotolerans]
MAIFEIYKSDRSTAWYYRLKATGSQENILESEGYATRNAAMEGIESAKRNARFDQNFEVKETLFTSGGQWRNCWDQQKVCL